MSNILTRSLLTSLFVLLASCAGQPQKTMPEKATAEKPVAATKPGAISKQEHALYKEALTSLYKNDLDNAESQFKQLIKMRDDLAGPWANLALVYYNKKQPDQARKMITESFQRNPRQANAINLLGVLELDDGKIKPALEHFKQAVALRPDYANAHYNLAYTYDIYFQDARNAADQYIQYMKLIRNQDKVTGEWLDQLMGYIKKSPEKK